MAERASPTVVAEERESDFSAGFPKQRSATTWSSKVSAMQFCSGKCKSLSLCPLVFGERMKEGVNWGSEMR